MRRLYMANDDVMYSDQTQVGTVFNDDGTTTPVMLFNADLLMSEMGVHSLPYSGTNPDHAEMTVIIGNCPERNVELFHSLPSVAILPNPVTLATMQIGQYVDYPNSHFTAAHLDALMSWDGLGFLQTDTVLDLCRKLNALSPVFDLKLENAI